MKCISFVAFLFIQFVYTRPASDLNKPFCSHPVIPSLFLYGFIYYYHNVLNTICPSSLYIIIYSPSVFKMTISFLPSIFLQLWGMKYSRSWCCLFCNFSPTFAVHESRNAISLYQIILFVPLSYDFISMLLMDRTSLMNLILHCYV